VHSIQSISQRKGLPPLSRSSSLSLSSLHDLWSLVIYRLLSTFNPPRLVAQALVNRRVNRPVDRPANQVLLGSAVTACESSLQACHSTGSFDMAQRQGVQMCSCNFVKYAQARETNYPGDRHPARLNGSFAPIKEVGREQDLVLLLARPIVSRRCKCINSTCSSKEPHSGRLCYFYAVIIVCRQRHEQISRVTIWALL
jgi:hypothetical protein